GDDALPRLGFDLFVVLIERVDRRAQDVGIIDEIILHNGANLGFLLRRKVGGGDRGRPQGGDRAHHGGGERQSERSFHFVLLNSLLPRGGRRAAQIAIRRRMWRER